MVTDADLNKQVGRAEGEADGKGAAGPEAFEETPAVLLQGISKRFNDIYALKNVSVALRQGEILTLLGPVGAGKSTLIKLLLGFLQPDEGTISTFGTSDLRAVKARIGYLPEQPRYHANFTGYDYLLFQARLSGLTRTAARQVVNNSIDVMGLGALSRRRIGVYDRETLQRLGFAVALVSITGDAPGLLILDEPSDSLSRSMQLGARDLILNLKQQGVTVLLASQRITEIERTCTAVGILRGGQLITQRNVENDPRTIIVAVPGESAPESYPRLLAYLRGLHPSVTTSGGAMPTAPVVVSLPTGPQIMNTAGIKAAALRALVDAGWDVISVYVERKDLESIYLQTLRSKPHGVVAGGSAATGPLTNVIAPHDARSPATMGANTGPLPQMTECESLHGHSAGTFNHAALLPLAEGDSSAEGNGREPIEGRSLRSESTG